MGLASKVLQGDVLSAARLIRGLEDDVNGAAEELEQVYLHTGRAHVVGVSGAPGAGKSTLVGCLIGAFRKRDMKVGVVAVDPSSPFTGGAILGDRVRMQGYGVDREVFIRSLASRGWKGGLARAATSTIHVMDAMGKDVILVEAVGSGQGEVDIARIADTTVLVLTPGMGDDVQMMKAGLLEAADLLVINKSDVPGAEQLQISLQQMLSMQARSAAGGWTPPILMTQASCDRGTDGVAEAILKHRQYLKESGDLDKRRQDRARLELVWAVEGYLNSYIDSMDQARLALLVDELAQRKTNPRSVVLKIIAELSSGGRDGLFADRNSKDA